MQPFPQMFRCCDTRQRSMSDVQTRNELYENKQAEDEIRISRQPSKSESETAGSAVSIPDADSFHSVCSANERMEEEVLLQCVASGMLGPFSKNIVPRNDEKDGKAAESSAGSVMLRQRSDLLPQQMVQCHTVESSLPPLIGFETLKRVPLTNFQTANSWSELQGPEFKVRSGPNYKKLHLKVRSGKNLYHCYGMDVLRNAERIADMAELAPMRNMEIPYVPPDSGLPAVIVFNFQLVPDGGGWGTSTPKQYTSVVMYCVISPQYAALIGTDKEPVQFKLLRELLEKKHNTPVAMKCIVSMVDIEKVTLPSVIKSKNGKPFILKNSATIRTGHLPQHPDKPYFVEFDYDQSKWCWFARQATMSCRRLSTTVSVDIGLLMEAVADEDMPEQILCSMRAHNVDVTENVMQCPETLQSPNRE